MFLRALRILLCLSLAVASPVGVASAYTPKTQNALENFTFLEAIMDRVIFELGANVAYISKIQKCFGGDDSWEECEKEKKKIKNNTEVEYPFFRKHIFNNTFVFRSREIFRHLRTQIRKKNNKGASLEDLNISEWLNPMAKAKKIARAEILPIEFDEKEVNLWLHDKMMRITHRSKTPDEYGRTLVVENYPYNPNGYVKKICNEIHIETRERELRYKERLNRPIRYEYIDAETRPFCDQLELIYSKENGLSFKDPKFIHSKDEWYLENIIERAISLAAKSQKPLLRRFYDSVNERPYLALVNSGTPTDEEFVEIFQILKENALEELSIVQQKRKVALGLDEESKIRLERNQARYDRHSLMTTARRNFYTRNYTDEQKANLKRRTEESRPVNEGNFDVALEFMGYAPLVNTVLEEPNDAMRAMRETDFSEVVMELGGDYAWAQLGVMGKDMAKALWPIAVCIAPIGKIFQGVKWLGKTIMMGRVPITVADLLCYTASGVYANTYFLQTGKEYYAKAWRRIFSTREGGALLADMQELTDAEFGLALEYILWPTAFIPVLLTKRLSKESLELLDALKRTAQ